MNDWLDATKEQPMAGQSVLVYHYEGLGGVMGGHYAVAEYSPSINGWYVGEYEVWPAFWMPVPPPPRPCHCQMRGSIHVETQACRALKVYDEAQQERLDAEDERRDLRSWAASSRG